MKRFICSFPVICVLAMILLAPGAGAQTDRATLEGTITDPSGAVISGAKIAVTNVDTGITEERKTNSNGYYRFPGLAIGDYTVIAANSGFKTKSIEDVNLKVGQTRTLDLRLEIGQASEKI